jgi:hypothetical protein
LRHSRKGRKVLPDTYQSDKKPQQSRPTADEKLKPATRPAPAEADSPKELLYSGRKNGGTKRGNVATAPARKSVTNLTSLKSTLNSLSITPLKYLGNIYHSMKMVLLIGARSLINHAAGRPVASVTIPIIRKVHGGPSFWMRLSIAKLITVPPSPPPA